MLDKINVDLVNMHPLQVHRLGGHIAVMADTAAPKEAFIKRQCRDLIKSTEQISTLAFARTGSNAVGLPPAMLVEKREDHDQAQLSDARRRDLAEKVRGVMRTDRRLERIDCAATSVVADFALCTWDTVGATFFRVARYTRLCRSLCVPKERSTHSVWWREKKEKKEKKEKTERQRDQETEREREGEGERETLYSS